MQYCIKSLCDYLFAKEIENDKAFNKKSYIEGGGDPIVEDALEAGSP